MKQLYLVGNRELLDEECRQMNLGYYLIEEERDEKANTSLYGIQITKQTVKRGSVRTEKESTPALSYSRSFVEKMIFRLMEGSVTPIALLEVVDDMVGESLVSN